MQKYNFFERTCIAGGILSSNKNRMGSNSHPVCEYQNGCNEVLSFSFLVALCFPDSLQQLHIFHDPVEDGICVNIEGGGGVGVAHEVLD